MAITKVFNVKASVLSSISYIVNPDKTDSGLLVSSYACGVYSADLEFAMTADLGNHRGDVKAQHIIQSFNPGEVSPETAHEIGRKLALELTNGEHEFVIATHTNKSHTHNHIIVNQVSFTTHKKFRQNIETFKRMQRINDTLCAAYNLSVINKSDSKAKPYYDYKELRTLNTNRQLLKSTIDSCIPIVDSFSELIVMLDKLGYEVKETNKNISFKKDTWQRFTRLKSLGDNYSVDSINSRIKYKNIDATIFVAPNNTKLGLLSDLSNKLDKLKNPAYANKVALSDVKRIAATYSFLNDNNLTSVEQIDKALLTCNDEIKDFRSQIKDLEKEIDRLEYVSSLLKKRDDNQKFYAQYKKSGKSLAYKNAHLSELMLYESACTQLALNDVSPKISYDDVIKQLNNVTAKKDSLLNSYHEKISNQKQLSIAKKNVDLILSGRETDALSKRKRDMSL